MLDRQVGDREEQKQLSHDLSTWDEFNEQLLRRRFSTARVANDYRRVAGGFGGVAPIDRELEWTRESIASQMRKLDSLRLQLELYASGIEENEVLGPALKLQGTKIFVVHGHDGDTKYQVVEFLEKVTGDRPVVLHEQPDSGRTIIEKFEDHASEAKFAVVLLTADDEGRAKGEPDLRKRARQ